jgi:hypothetical protein
MIVRNIGAYLNGIPAGLVSATAGAGGDGTEVDGGFGSVKGFASAALVIAYEAVLAENETLSIAANVQDATDASGTGAADYGATLANAVVATGGSGGSTERGVVVLDIDLLGGTQGDADGTCSREFMQGQFTPDLSATGTDTADVAAILILGGADVNPAN